MDEAEFDVLAYMAYPKDLRTKLHSTNPLERLNGEIKRRTNVVGIFPCEAAVTTSTMLPIITLGARSAERACSTLR